MPIVSSKGLAPYTGSFKANELKHLYRRTHFGMSRTDFNNHSSKTLAQMLSAILVATPEPAPPLNHYENLLSDPTTKEPAIPYGMTWVNTVPTKPEINGWKIRSFKSWLLMNFLSDDTITEKMTFFLHSFLPITHDVNDPRYLYFNYKMLRANCLGNFKTLIKSVSLDPGMLVFLNGDKNQKIAPDENYARELQELFTIGKDFTPIYSEDDIKQAAKVLTGYQINTVGPTYKFTSSRHDTSDKQFSSYYGNKIITGKSGAAGETELDELIDMIFANNDVALHFCRNLYKFFVYYEIDATVEANVIVPLANMFRTGNYEILPVLQTLFNSEHFFDTDTFGSMIKSPVDYMLGQVKEMEVKLPPNTNIETQYEVYNDLNSYCALLRQEPYDPPSVSGWEAYYQAPLFHETWITTDTVANRNKLSYYLIVGYTKRGFWVGTDLIDFTKKFTNPSDPNVLIDEALAWLHTISATPELKAFLKTILLFGQSQDYYWSNIWDDHINSPTDAVKKKRVTDLLSSFYKYILELAEYHLI